MNSISARRHSFRSSFPAIPEAAEQASSSLAEDLKLFATFWLGGLVFFGTFLA